MPPTAPPARFSDAPHRSAAELEQLGVTGRRRKDGVQALFDQATADAAEKWLSEAPAEFLLCRYDHRFPRLLNKNGRLSRGVKSEPTQVSGSYQISLRCPDCGTLKIFTYDKGGDLYEAARHYHYEWPTGYKWPKGAADYITLAECRNTAYNAMDAGAQLVAAAERAA